MVDSEVLENNMNRIEKNCGVTELLIKVAKSQGYNKGNLDCIDNVLDIVSNIQNKFSSSKDEEYMNTLLDLRNGVTK